MVFMANWKIVKARILVVRTVTRVGVARARELPYRMLVTFGNTLIYLKLLTRAAQKTLANLVLSYCFTNQHN